MNIFIFKNFNKNKEKCHNLFQSFKEVEDESHKAALLAHGILDSDRSAFWKFLLDYSTRELEIEMKYKSLMEKSSKVNLEFSNLEDFNEVIVQLRRIFCFRKNFRLTPLLCHPKRNSIFLITRLLQMVSELSIKYLVFLHRMQTITKY